VSVFEAVRAELDGLPVELAGSGLAAAALEIAAGLDGDASLAMKSMAAKELRDTLAVLRGLAPPAERNDLVDQLRQRREKKIGRAEAAG
jgi:hypothetical protein